MALMTIIPLSNSLMSQDTIVKYFNPHFGMKIILLEDETFIVERFSLTSIIDEDGMIEISGIYSRCDNEFILNSYHQPKKGIGYSVLEKFENNSSDSIKFQVRTSFGRSPSDSNIIYCPSGISVDNQFLTLPASGEISIPSTSRSITIHGVFTDYYPIFPSNGSSEIIVNLKNPFEKDIQLFEHSTYFRNERFEIYDDYLLFDYLGGKIRLERVD